MSKNIRQAFTKNAEEFDALVIEMLSENERINALYFELLLCVGNKYPNESRHETALRYIRNAETSSGAGATDDR